MRMDDIFTDDFVCERWGISRKTLQRWLTYGIPNVLDDVPHMRIGRKIRFTGAQVREIEAAMSMATVAS